MVNDGEEGLNAAMNENPTLILLDIMLPSMSGLETVSYTHLDVYKRQVPNDEVII